MELQAKSRLLAADMANTAVAEYMADNRKVWKKAGGDIDIGVQGKNVRAFRGPEQTPSIVSMTLQANGKWKVEMLVRFASSHKEGEKITDDQAAALLKSFVDKYHKG